MNGVVSRSNAIVLAGFDPPPRATHAPGDRARATTAARARGAPARAPSLQNDRQTALELSLHDAPYTEGSSIEEAVS